MKKPNLFLVGQPRAASTALYSFLKEHPDVFMCYPKEPGYFHSDFNKEIADFHKGKQRNKFENYEAYLELFRDWDKEKYGGDATVHYLYSKVAAEEIYNFNPDARVVIVLREPVDFLHSLHSQFFFMGYEDEEDFEKAINLEEDRKNGKRIPKKIEFPSQIFYSDRIKYYEQVKRFYDKFGKDKINMIIFEDFKKDNAGWFKKLLKFLDVDSSFQPNFELINETKVLRSRHLRFLTSFIYKWKKIPQAVLPEKFYAFLKKYIYKATRASAKKELSPELRIELMKKFKPEVEKISKFLNRDLVKFWGYDQV
ncbi:MAG: sulfotransferase [Candidatus Nanoarchaeia archaeon]|nr:sulfotransferase [Candidatus Nanoarchaeia archaeon]